MFPLQFDVSKGKKKRKYRPLSEQRIEQINFFYDAHLCRAEPNGLRAARWVAFASSTVVETVPKINNIDFEFDMVF